MGEFRFTNDHSKSELGNVIDVLRRPRLWVPTERDYPDFSEWLEDTEAALAADTKRAMLAYYLSRSIGAVVYRRHKTLPNVLAIRNISVDEMRGQGVGTFLVRSVIAEATIDYPGVDTVMVDTKVDNTAMLDFLRHELDFSIEEITDLYGKDAGLDAVLTRPIQLAA
jgi:ribosomal protein S18 acetylase RimI-like enzyme